MSVSDEIGFNVYHGGTWVVTENDDDAYIGGEVLSFQCKPEDL
ncbi:unnamed protein product [Arabidopsis halleri]